MSDPTMILAGLMADHECRLWADGHPCPTVEDFLVLLPEFIRRTGMKEADARTFIVQHCGGVVENV